ncbi:pyrolysin [Thermococcus sp. MAR1]|uniref:pyrolysin n=1 Tax=Thermococcus sp. MAR1 TaxID=1638263 RepID=UPI00143A5902|nr:pyrolysin [Thermococcus sp. MAR1]NJE10173.1 pyrolysin [Thermococcus sp. MAR1]
MKKVAAIMALFLLVLVPFAGAVSAATWSYENFIKQSMAWYYLYQNNEYRFNELYNLSVQMNVSNETLSLAMELYNNASAEYSQALTYGIPQESRTLSWVVFSVHIRKAYLYMSQAVEVLEEALAPLENEAA